MATNDMILMGLVAMVVLQSIAMVMMDNRITRLDKVLARCIHESILQTPVVK